MKDFHTSSFLFGLVSGVVLVALAVGCIFIVGMHHRFERGARGGMMRWSNGRPRYQFSDTQRGGSGSDVNKGVGKVGSGSKAVPL